MEYSVRRILWTLGVRLEIGYEYVWDGKGRVSERLERM